MLFVSFGFDFLFVFETRYPVAQDGLELSV